VGTAQDCSLLILIRGPSQKKRRKQFISEICSILNMVGLSQHHYAGQGYQIGAATSAALARVEDSTIQALGRWHSATFLQYVHMPREQLALLFSIGILRCTTCPISRQ